MKFVLFLIVAFFVFNQTNTTQTAQDKCRQLLQMNAERRSYFLNEGCAIKCSINGEWWRVELEDGLACPANSNGKCHQGDCRFHESPRQLGQIDVWFDRGEFKEYPEHYVVACIQNSSERIEHPISIEKCAAHCQSTSKMGRNPEWKQHCATINSSESILFTNYSRVAFDVWVWTPNPEYEFVGGADLLISELLQNDQNGISISVKVKDGEQIFVNVSFTAVPSGAFSPYRIPIYQFIIAILLINTIFQ